MTDFFMPAIMANALQMHLLLQRLHVQPEILKKCQDQIQNVVGQSRLPTLDDRQKCVPKERAKYFPISCNCILIHTYTLCIETYGSRRRQGIIEANVLICAQMFQCWF